MSQVLQDYRDSFWFEGEEVAVSNNEFQNHGLVAEVGPAPTREVGGHAVRVFEYLERGKSEKGLDYESMQNY